MRGDERDLGTQLIGLHAVCVEVAGVLLNLALREVAYGVISNGYGVIRNSCGVRSVSVVALM